MKKNLKVIDYSKNPFEISDVVKKIRRLQRAKGIALDLGSGTGRHALYLAKHGFSVTALDVSKEKLSALQKEARARGLKIRTIEKNITAYHPSRRFDVVVANNSLHFLKGSRVERAIKLIKGYTKRGGLNVIAVHTAKNSKSHHRPYLFKPNELKHYYSDWKILWYYEGLGRWFITKEWPKPVRRYSAKIIARKP